MEKKIGMFIQVYAHAKGGGLKEMHERIRKAPVKLRNASLA